jgi:hypothetical protein
MNSWLLKGLYFLQLNILFVSLFSSAATADVGEKYLQLGCSDWKPYCYKEGSQVKGQMIDVTRAIVAEADFESTLEVLPWKRVYQQGLNTPNFLILGLGRTEKREALFKWIAPLKNPSEIYAYQHISSDFILTNKNDFSNYTIAVERGSYTHEFLMVNGHDEDKIILVSRYEQLYKMVESHRAQLFLIDSKVFRPEAIRSNFNPDDFKPSLLAFVITEYLATGLGTSDSVVERLKVSYGSLLQQEKIKLPD